MSSRKLDVLIVGLLALGAALGSWQGSALAGAALDVRGRSAGGYDDIWFDADVSDLHQRLTTGNYEQNHTVRHPLVPLMARLPMRLFLRAVPGADPVNVVRSGLTVVAALWASLLFLTLRLVGCRRSDATLFSLVGLTSAAAMFWLVVPDTFALGSLGIWLALAAVASASRWPAREWLTTTAAVTTLSVTVTNGVFGAIAAAVLHSRRRALQVVANAGCVVLVLWGLQRFIYPSSGFPYGYDQSYRSFILSADMRTPGAPLAALLLDGMVMPSVQTIQRITQENYLVLSVQQSWPGSGGAAGLIAVIAWTSVLVLGASAAWSGSVPRALVVFLAAAIASQLGLHVLFGEETFLYTMHVMPLLLVLAAMGTLTRARPLVLGFAAVLLVSGAVNNWLQFSRSLELAQQITSRIGS